MESVGPRYQWSATLQVSDDVAHFIPPAVPGLSLLPTAGDLLEQSGIDRHGRSFLVGFRMLFEPRSEEHTSELQSLMRISYAVFCLNKKTIQIHHSSHRQQ